MVPSCSWCTASNRQVLSRTCKPYQVPEMSTTRDPPMTCKFKDRQQPGVKLVAGTPSLPPVSCCVYLRVSASLLAPLSPPPPRSFCISTLRNSCNSILSTGGYFSLNPLTQIFLLVKTRDCFSFKLLVNDPHSRQF